MAGKLLLHQEIMLLAIRDGTYLDEARPELNAQCIPIRIVAEEIQIAI